jgi:hypothetical protein
MLNAVEKCVPHFVRPCAILLTCQPSFAPDRHFTIFTGDVVESAVWAVDEPVRPPSPYLRVLADQPFLLVHRALPKTSTSGTKTCVWSTSPRKLKVSSSVVERLLTPFSETSESSLHPLSSPPSPFTPQLLTFSPFCSDIAPVNAFPRAAPSLSPPPTSAQWVFDLAAKDWHRWIGRKAAEQVRTKSGCYSRVHPGTRLKIVSLNTNYWYKQNCTSFSSSSRYYNPSLATSRSFLTTY